ncbi:metallo-beta-lactamase domain-containing protein 1 isoform X1 [Schistocerca cancellata]|uniref:metallo-beta-lactamase domain-containing protein 1 isoform X1 n=1 Tax=Schistocerca cancellata TaxID=274614 RepID=UPI0021175C52|nr:metallo-beta-lactamase domain-containing protein 1 isoform X1 [Schistocerca cancellata]
MAYEVHVLYDGFSKMTENGMEANCSCTLIKGPKKIIVDTMTAWDKELIIEGLARHGVTCEEIDYVVCTHGHSDHIGNNNLFMNAKHIVGFSVSFKNTYFIHPFETGEPYIIDEDVKVIPTPGHTLSDVSVIVKTKSNGIFAITGDLFEREEDIKDPHLWQHVAGSDEPGLQRQNRNRVLQLADWVVPGHGPKFQVTQKMKQDVEDILNNSDNQFHYI